MAARFNKTEADIPVPTNLLGHATCFACLFLAPNCKWVRFLADLVCHAHADTTQDGKADTFLRDQILQKIVDCAKKAREAEWTLCIESSHKVSACTTAGAFRDTSITVLRLTLAAAGDGVGS